MVAIAAVLDGVSGDALSGGEVLTWLGPDDGGWDVLKRIVIVVVAVGLFVTTYLRVTDEPPIVQDLQPEEPQPCRVLILTISTSPLTVRRDGDT